MAALPRMDASAGDQGTIGRPAAARGSIYGRAKAEQLDWRWLARALFFSVVGVMACSYGPLRAAKRIAGSSSDPADLASVVRH